MEMDINRENSGNSTQVFNMKKMEKKESKSTNLDSSRMSPKRNQSRSLLNGLLKFNNKVE